MTNKILNILLSSLGFTDKQIKIYLVLLQYGKLNPQAISSHSQINRSTVYAVCSELIQKGIIAEELAGKTKVFSALDPVELHKLWRKDEKELQIKKAKINSAISELEKIAKDTKYIIPKINFIPEEDIEQHLTSRVLSWDQSMSQYDSTWWGFQGTSFVDQYEHWIKWYWSQTNPNIQLRMFSNQSEKDLALKNIITQRVIKNLADTHNFNGTLWILGDFIVILQTEHKPFYLYELHEPGLAANLRFMFQLLWGKN